MGHFKQAFADPKNDKPGSPARSPALQMLLLIHLFSLTVTVGGGGGSREHSHGKMGSNISKVYKASSKNFWEIRDASHLDGKKKRSSQRYNQLAHN